MNTEPPREPRRASAAAGHSPSPGDDQAIAGLPTELIDTDAGGDRPHDPFFFPGPPGADACLLIHGSTGTAGDVRGLGEYLHERGLTVRGVSLPGHARRPAQLEGVTWETCFAVVHQAWQELQAAYRRVHVLGFSYGGAQALHLAAAEPVDDLILLAPGLEINITAREIVGASLGLVPGTWMHTRLRWNLNLLTFFRQVRAELSRISCPLLMLHACDDPLVKVQSSLTIFDQVASVDRRLVVLTEGGHLLPWGPVHKQVWEAVGEHIVNGGSAG